ncbi:MAG: nuclear transport factor 2 family protein [Bacteroidales bacterium]|nr:nuclear transport factor 2 family protein [Bacteroidales bacterium]
MRKLIPFVLLITIMFSACEQQKQETKSEKTSACDEREAIADVLKNYVIAIEEERMDLVKKVWAPDDDIVVFGTESDEKHIGWDSIEKALENQFANFDDTYISVKDQIIKVSKTGKTGWFSEIINYNFIYDGTPNSFEGNRFTGVLEKRNGKWYIVQSHMSIPADLKLEK